MPEQTAEPATPDYQFFFDAFNASPIGIALEDLSGQPFAVNPALCSMLGFTAEELCQKHCSQFSPPADAEKDWALFQQLRAGVIDHYQLEKRFFRRDGSLVWGRLSISLFQSRDSTLVVAMVEDITEKRTAQEDLQRSEASLQKVAEQLRHRANQLRRLASDLTLAEQRVREQLAQALHDDLQQLLFGAGMYLDLASKSASTTRSAESEWLARARSFVDQAVESVRTMSLELFPPVLHHGGMPVALPWLADRMRQRYGLNVDLSVDPKADPEWRDMRTLLFECVRELLFNVVKHAKIDRAAVDVTLTSDDAIRITVSDEGAGFDAAIMADHHSAHPIGLGLFSIRERLALLGGRLEVASSPAQGARFTLLAPRTVGGAVGPGNADDRSARRSEGTARHEAGRVHQRLLRIVIADDHASVRQTIRELFARQPALRVVGEAVDGYEAIAQAHAHHPDVMLIDVSMPRLDGIEATRRIHAELPDVRIFGTSADDSPTALHAIEEAGAEAFFMKRDLPHLINQLVPTAANELSPGVN